MSNNNALIHPLEEIAAYETLWESMSSASFKNIALKFQSKPGSLPSDFVDSERIQKNLFKIEQILDKLRKFNNLRPNVLMYGTFNYPEKLRNATEPVELLYYSGNLNLLYSPSVAVVGTRKPTEQGIRRTRQMVKKLVSDGFTIVSGLAQGIDTVAHKTAIESGGNTIAVIGTPLSEVYPKENSGLQSYIGKHHLLISQVPFLKYQNQNYKVNRLFFPERNKTMSAITDATIIIEAGETSGTLVQARAALKQNRKLFILNSSYENKNITWPQYYLERGAIKVTHYEDIRNELLK